jgi:hypothetical protein
MEEIMTDALYESVVNGSEYDLEAALKHNRSLYLAKTIARQMPEIEEQFVEKEKKGCSINYALALLSKMRKAGRRESYLAITLKPNKENGLKTECYATVYYRKSGAWYIADPMADIEEKNQQFKYKAIPIRLYKKINEEVWIFDPNGVSGDYEFYKEFMNSPELVLR